jgi:hypothetical protein
MALEPLQLKPAILQEIWWSDKGALQENGPSGQKGKQFTVQFNPQTLKINFSNQKAGGEQPKGSSTQFVGKGVTKLTMELWFDISYAQAQGRVQVGKDIDVRNLTQQVAYFMAPQAVKGKPNTYVPPGIRVSWGTFLFAGIMDSMDETLDLFSDQGLPLRASVNISVSRQEIIFDATKTAALAGAPGALPFGVQPFDAMNAGEPLQKRAGPNNWRNAALANGIENPRMMSPGALVNLSAGVSISGAASLGVDLSAGAQVGVGAGLSAQAGIGISGGAEFSAGAQFSAGGGAVAGTQTTVGAGGGVQLGFVASTTASASASAQVSAGAGVQISGGFGGGV